MYSDWSLATGRFSCFGDFSNFYSGRTHRIERPWPRYDRSSGLELISYIDRALPASEGHHDSHPSQTLVAGK